MKENVLVLLLKEINIIKIINSCNNGYIRFLILVIKIYRIK